MSLQDLPIELQLHILSYLGKTDPTIPHPRVQLYKTCRAYRNLLMSIPTLLRNPHVLSCQVVRNSNWRELYLQHFLTLLLGCAPDSVRRTARKILVFRAECPSYANMYNRLATLRGLLHSTMPGQESGLMIPVKLMFTWTLCYNNMFSKFLTVKVDEQNISAMIILSIDIYALIVQTLCNEP